VNPTGPENPAQSLTQESPPSFKDRLRNFARAVLDPVTTLLTRMGIGPDPRPSSSRTSAARYTPAGKRASTARIMSSA